MHDSNIVDLAGVKLVHITDSQILKALGVGPDQALVMAHAGRLSVVKHIDHPNETYCLDGRPVLVVGPVQISVEWNQVSQSQSMRVWRDMWQP